MEDANEKVGGMARGGYVEREYRADDYGCFVEDFGLLFEAIDVQVYSRSRFWSGSVDGL